MTIEEFVIKDGGIWIPKQELERIFNYLRKKGYQGEELYRTEGWTQGQHQSTSCHAKADFVWDLISLIEEQE